MEAVLLALVLDVAAACRALGVEDFAEDLGQVVGVHDVMGIVGLAELGV